MIGQVAVTFGGRQLRREVDARLRDARQAAEGVVGFIPGMATPPGSNGAGAGDGRSASPAETPAKPAAARKPATKSTAARKATKATKATATKATATKPAAAKAPAKRTRKTTTAATAASAADLPIREYDGLSASQVVSRLTGLTPEELRAVRSYEESSRGRRTVILAIDRLLP
jgi:hypothetical protein